MEKINIAELLKDCPKGMELDCTMYDNLYFKCIRGHAIYPIVCYTVDSKGEKHETSFNRYGKHTPIDTAKCVIYPKGQTTWEGFVPPFKFKDGDILYCDANDYGENNDDFKYIFIFDKLEDGQDYYSHCHLGGSEFYDEKTFLVNDYPVRFATDDEKEKLFKVIKENGYKWDSVTKTLVKLIQPKFKVGDKVRHKNNHNVIFTITSITEDSYGCGVASAFWFEDQDDYELSPNKFDIAALKPFDKVLVRDYDTQEWRISFFGRCNGLGFYKYSCINGCGYAQCIPYKNNEHLLGEKDDCNEYYKTWK